MRTELLRGRLSRALGLLTERCALEPEPRGELVCDGMGTRAHDHPQVHQRSLQAGRPIMGELVFDTMRGVDFLETRNFVDNNRIGVVGLSRAGRSMI